MTVLFLLIAVASAAAIRQFLLRPERPTVPAATQFRSYLADPAARMVAYSPSEDALSDPRLLRLQLEMLREKFDGLSLYGCTSSTPAVVEMARTLGYRAVLLTIWAPRSESELATASSIVRDQATHMALAVSIGSEGLMEKRYALDDLLYARNELLDRNTAPTSVEMTTTEPWWLYLLPEYAKVRTFGEFTSVNIHVVWDADIVDPALAASWTRDRAEEVRKLVMRPILLREAGIPGGGSSPRGGLSLTFNRTMQAEFWKSWLALPQRPPLVAFEGIDNAGKHWRDFEGSWGLMDSALKPWPAWNVFPPLAAAPH
jgi:hypothetical protein